MAVQNIEASTGYVEVTKAMVLSRETPFKKLEVVSVEDGARIDMVIKSIKSGDKVSLTVSREVDDANKNIEYEDIINIQRRPKELKVSFFVEENDLEKLFICIFNEIKWTTPYRFLYDGTMYEIDNIQDFIKK